MATLTKNAISVTGRDRAKRTTIWDHKGYESGNTFHPTQVIIGNLATIWIVFMWVIVSCTLASCIIMTLYTPTRVDLVYMDVQ